MGATISKDKIKSSILYPLIFAPGAGAPALPLSVLIETIFEALNWIAKTLQGGVLIRWTASKQIEK